MENFMKKNILKSKGPSFLTIFIIVICIGLCIITYGVLNHTDLM